MFMMEQTINEVYEQHWLLGMIQELPEQEADSDVTSPGDNEVTRAPRPRNPFDLEFAQLGPESGFLSIAFHSQVAEQPSSAESSSVGSVHSVTHSLVKLPCAIRDGGVSSSVGPVHSMAHSLFTEPRAVGDDSYSDGRER